jgi:hypothetical protein
MEGLAMETGSVLSRLHPGPASESDSDPGSGDWSTAVALSRLGGRQLTAGRYSDAEPRLRRSLEIKENHLGKGDPALAKDLKQLVYACGAQHKLHETEPLIETALVMVERVLGPERQQILATLRRLAGAYREQSRSKDTYSLIEISIAIVEAACGNDRAASEAAIEFYAEILAVLNQNIAAGGR